MNYVRIEDLKKAEAMVRDLGGEIILPRTDIPRMGSFFLFKDPLGSNDCLLARRAATLITSSWFVFEREPGEVEVGKPEE